MVATTVGAGTSQSLRHQVNVMCPWRTKWTKVADKPGDILSQERDHPYFLTLTLHLAETCIKSIFFKLEYAILSLHSLP